MFSGVFFGIAFLFCAGFFPDALWGRGPDSFARRDFFLVFLFGCAFLVDLPRINLFRILRGLRLVIFLDFAMVYNFANSIDNF